MSLLSVYIGINLLYTTGSHRERKIVVVTL